MFNTFTPAGLYAVARIAGNIKLRTLCNYFVGNMSLYTELLKMCLSILALSSVLVAVNNY